MARIKASRTIEVVFRLGAPMHVLRAEIAQRLFERPHLFQISHHQRERRLEMSLQRCEIGGKERAQLRRCGEQLGVETRRERARLG